MNWRLHYSRVRPGRRVCRGFVVWPGDHLATLASSPQKPGQKLGQLTVESWRKSCHMFGSVLTLFPLEPKWPKLCGFWTKPPKFSSASAPGGHLHQGVTFVKGGSFQGCVVHHIKRKEMGFGFIHPPAQEIKKSSVSCKA